MISKKHRSNFTSLFLDIIQEVQVTEYYFPEFSIAKFFAEIGGSLGIWLGVGTMQLIKSFADVACIFRRSRDYDLKEINKYKNKSDKHCESSDELTRSLI